MYKFVCNEADFDTATSTCTAGEWVPDAGILPPLSAEDGSAIAAAIIGVWIAGAAARWGRKAIN